MKNMSNSRMDLYLWEWQTNDLFIGGLLILEAEAVSKSFGCFWDPIILTGSRSQALNQEMFLDILQLDMFG